MANPNPATAAVEPGAKSSPNWVAEDVTDPQIIGLATSALDPGLVFQEVTNAQSLELAGKYHRLTISATNGSDPGFYETFILEKPKKRYLFQKLN